MKLFSKCFKLKTCKTEWFVNKMHICEDFWPQGLTNVSTGSGATEVPTYPVPSGIAGPRCPRAHKYGDLILQVAGFARG